MRSVTCLAFTFVFAVFLCQEAIADKIYVIRSKPDVEKRVALLKRTQPNLSDEEIVNLLNPGARVIEKLRADLAPAPTFQDKRGTYFQGRILKFEQGVRGPDITDPKNHDKILFEAYGRNGLRKSRAPAEISGLYIFATVHEFDTIGDFSYAFSNRHELLEQVFGADKHIDSLFQIISKSPNFKLFRSGPDDTPDGVVEGRFTSYLRDGPRSLQDIMLTWSYSRVDPYQSGPLFGMPNIHGQLIPPGMAPGRRFQRQFPPLPNAATGGSLPMTNAVAMEIDDLIAAMARMARHSVGEGNLRAAANAAVGFLCDLARIDVQQMETVNNERAHRGVQVGFGCYQSLVAFLEGNEFYIARTNTNNALLPVTGLDLQMAVLEAVRDNMAFRYHLGAVPLDRSAVQFGLINPNSLSFMLFRQLAILATQAESQQIKTLAGSALARLLTTDRNGNAKFEKAFLDIHQRYFRAILYAALTNSNSGYGLREPAEKLLCNFGWGYWRDVNAFIDWTFSYATASGISDGERRRFVRYLGQILAWANTAGPLGAPTKAYFSTRKSTIAKNVDAGFGTKSDIAFLKALETHLTESNACSGIVRVNRLELGSEVP